LTGKPELPLYGLWDTINASGAIIREVMWSSAKFRELKIPCDAIYLDIDYMEGFRCFTWNKEYFPDQTEW
jgi:alpha-glucosidase